MIAALSVLAQVTTTTVRPAAAGQDPDPLNAGGVVFLVVSLVIFGGALALYLRHRPRVPR